MNDQPIMKPGEFVLPPNFVPHTDFGDVFLEDIDDDDDIELWFMQAPHNVELKQLNKQKISLSDVTLLEPDDSSKTKLECTAVPYSSKQINPYSLLMPRKADNTLGVVKKKFAGHILVSQSVNFPSYPHSYTLDNAAVCEQADPKEPPSSQNSEVLDVVETESPVVEGSSCKKKSSKKKLRKKSGDDNNVAIDAELLSEQVKEYCTNDEVHLETETVETCTSYLLPEVKVKKSKKKKKKKEALEANSVTNED